MQLEIRQVQPEEWGVYRLPGLMIAIDGTRVPLNIEGRETTITLEKWKQRPREIVVDPDGWWLMEATVSSER